jgi:hypothetical protein
MFVSARNLTQNASYHVAVIFQTVGYAIGFVVGLSQITCDGGVKHEASTLLFAVDRYRRADNASKTAEAHRVADVVCTHASVCAAKRACIASIDPTARALTMKEEVARRLADVELKRIAVDSPEAQALPRMLDEAERLLNEGRARMPDCEKRLTDLQVEYGA